MELFYHPLSRFSQKVLIALYEKQANFYPRVVRLDDPFSRRSFQRLYGPGSLPLLKTRNGQLLPESSIIIEYVDTLFCTGTRLMPQENALALEVRLYDRLCDNRLSLPLRELEAGNDRAQNQLRVKQIENNIHEALAEFDRRLAERHWLCGESLTLADCALIPCLLSAQSRFQLLDYEHLGRYWIQAQVRGSVTQVKEEIELALIDEPGRRPLT